MYISSNKYHVLFAHPGVVLSGLRPQTRYHVWLQAYLRNGKVIESNVLEVATNDRKDGFGGGVGGGGE